MTYSIQTLSFISIFTPLITGLIAGTTGKRIHKQGAHTLTILGVSISFIAALLICKSLFIDNQAPLDKNIYTWAASGSFSFYIGFLIDKLSAAIMAVVTFVSLTVHIYSMGYMKEDEGYQRFFSYISLFTFAMLMLVAANNFLQLFFGWEGVGLVSYLLIGFWFKKESANQGSLKAFLVNRVGDFGFLLGIAAILDYTGTLNLHDIFLQTPQLATQTITIFSHHEWSALTVICILLFIGAMGKSAQMPLHIWLPESMEGPTPISALIHAATMVTAGIYLIARLSPLFEYSTTALSFVLIIGASSALFTGILALVQYDIKRVVAYSTLSQLGYMVAALGASAYSASIFHLITHAFFKALLFLAAGSVIVALHHEQDMRRMGNLWRVLPITYATFLIGALSLSAIPPFSGFFSKDLIIEAIHHAQIPGASYAFWCVAIGAFITPLYIFRAFFLTFHGKSHVNLEKRSHLHESSWPILLPLIILAIPSILAGVYLIKPIIFEQAFASSITVLPVHDVLAKIPFTNSLAMISHTFVDSIFTYLSIAGILTAYFAYQLKPQLPTKLATKFSLLYRLLVYKYGFDTFNEYIFVRGSRALATLFYQVGDIKILDNTFVNGSGRAVAWFSRVLRRVQSGYLYHYALVMMLGLLMLLYWLLLG